MAQRTRIKAAAAVLALLAVTACGSDDEGADRGSGPVATDTVTVKDFKFAPEHVTVAPGTTVTWRFEDDDTHSVVLDDGSFKSKEHGAGASEAHAFPSAGEFTYKCGIHPSMTGSVVVKA